ncbi:MAG: hypothetical protein ACJ8KX_09435 [Chthoniobacterales bacterium]
MSDENKDKHPKKKVTAATTDAPQEEFISPANVPTKTENSEPPDPQRPVETSGRISPNE